MERHIISKRLEELKTLIAQNAPDLVLIQKTHLQSQNSTPNIDGLFSARTDIVTENIKGGGLISYIK